MYFLYKDSTLYQSKDLIELALPFNIEITTKGEVIFEGETDTISYNPSEYDQDEIFKDFVYTRMIQLLKRKGVRIFKGEEL